VHNRTPPRRSLALGLYCLRSGKVEEISLDHDLGLFTTEGKESTGYAVLEWLEGEVAIGTAAFDIPIISIHSANPVGRKRVEQAIASMGPLLTDRETDEDPSRTRRFIQGVQLGAVLALVIGTGVAVSNEDASAEDGLLVFVLVSLFGAPFLGAFFWLWYVVLGGVERALRKRKAP
jgi:hypothetical protein